MATLRQQNLKNKGITKKNPRPRFSITDPFEKFWPLLDSNASKILVDEMEKTLCKENGKLRVNWFTLKKLPLDVRKCQIKELSKEHKAISPHLEAQRLILKTGINEVSRYIEKDQIACCLIAEDVANCMIAKHLLFMTAAKKIPALILPDMRLITKRILGFSSAALGLKCDVLNSTDNSLHNLYQTVVKLSNQSKSPYHKQTTTNELKSGGNPIKLNINIENYLLRKPREGMAFIPKGTLNIRTLNDSSFIPIEKNIVEHFEHFEQDEQLIELPSTTTALFSIDTNPLQIEDIGESVERKPNTSRKPLRYYELKMKKMKPNPDRKHKGKNADTKNN